MVLQHNFILSQRAGFVGAENIHRAEVLNGVQVLNNDFLLRQFHRPARQRGGDNHRQHFRRQAYRDRERKQRRFPPVAFGIAVNDQHDRRHDQHKADQQHTDAADAFLKRILLAFLLAHAASQLTKPGLAARCNDNRLRRSAHHVGAHKAQRVAFQRIALLRVAGCRHFFYRQRFARERSLRDKQIARLNNA